MALSDPIKVGLLCSTRGSTALLEQSQWRGACLAVEEINARGGIDGRELVVLHYDPGSDPVSFRELAERLIRTFRQDSQGRRPVFGGTEKFQNDPYWRDNILFYEYFHGDNGTGLGASHQTGWTGLVAKLLQQSGE